MGNGKPQHGWVRAHCGRMGMLALNLLFLHDPLFWLVGRLNRRFRAIRTVFVAYPVTQEYADDYAYRWVQRRCRWSPWLAGIYMQNGMLGLMTVISSSDEDFFNPADVNHNRQQLEALVQRTERIRRLLCAERISFAGILPGVLQTRAIRTVGVELEVTVEAVIQAETKLRAQIGYAESVPLILLGGKGYIGRRLAERLAHRETYVVDILPGRRINHETWPLPLQNKNAILINLTKKAVISDYMQLFWKELVLLNEVYPEPSPDEIAFVSNIGVQVYHIVGIKARALPRFPRAYAGGIPCCAAWNAPDMEVLLSRLN